MKRSGSAPGSAAPQCGNNPHRGWYSRGYLPHLDASHLIQFITYRLADSLPATVHERLKAEVASRGLAENRRRAELRQQIDRYLDAGQGSCVLRIPAIAACIEDTWQHFDGERYRLLEWVVMPNHCHVLIEAFQGIPLGKIVLSWKNYTARFINDYLSRTGVRRSQIKRSQVWQRDYWDRFIRDERHFEATKHYIAMNPVKAGLVDTPEAWPWSSAARKVDNATPGSTAPQCGS